MKELLSKDILNKDLIEVAGALEKVRYYVKKEKFMDTNAFIERYRMALVEHWIEWYEAVGETNEELGYEEGNSIFQRANRLLALPRPRLKIGDRYEVLSYMSELDQQVMMLTGINEVLVNQEESYYELVEQLGEVATDEESNLVELRQAVIKLFEAQTRYYVVDIPLEWEGLEIEELKAYICKKAKTIKFEVSGKGTMTELLQSMSKAQLAKQTYYNYKSAISGKEVSVEKKFLVNMVLFLGLDSYTANALIEAEGYNVQYSTKEEDKLVAKALRLGTGGWYLNELLEAKESVVFKKRFFQNRKQSLAYIRYYDRQDDIQKKKLKGQYASALQVVGKKMCELDNRLTNRIGYWNGLISKNEKKNEELVQEFTELFKQYQSYLSKVEIDEIVVEWLGRGVDVISLVNKVEIDKPKSISYLKARMATIEREYEDRTANIREIGLKINEIYKKAYSLNDLFNYYKSFNEEEEDEDILAVETITLTYDEIKEYKCLNIQQQEMFWKNILNK